MSSTTAGRRRKCRDWCVVEFSWQIKCDSGTRAARMRGQARSLCIFCFETGLANWGPPNRHRFQHKHSTTLRTFTALFPPGPHWGLGGSWPQRWRARRVSHPLQSFLGSPHQQLRVMQRRMPRLETSNGKP